MGNNVYKITKFIAEGFQKLTYRNRTLLEAFW